MEKSVRLRERFLRAIRFVTTFVTGKAIRLQPHRRRLWAERLEERWNPAGDTLTLDIIESSVSEATGGVVSSATLTRSGDTSASLVVTLLNSDSSEIYVPPTVTIPAGKSQVAFDVESINDPTVDGPMTSTITARAENMADALDTITVMDDDTPAYQTIGGRLSGSLGSSGGTETAVYHILSRLTVPSGKTLTIAAGSHLLAAAGKGVEIVVEGAMVAVGKPGQEVLFTSDAVQPAVNQWKGITIRGTPTQSSLFEHVEISYASTGINVEWGDANVVVRQSHIHHHAEFGISVLAGGDDFITADDVQLIGNEIDHANVGVSLVSSLSGCDASHNAALVEKNDIHDHQTGIRLLATGSNGCTFPQSSSVAGAITSNHVHDNQIGIDGSSSHPFKSYHSLSSRIENNLVEGNAATGILLKAFGDSTLRAEVRNNTVVNNGGAGIEHNVGATDFVIQNNIVANNLRGISGTVSISPTSGAVHANLLFNNRSGDFVNYPASYGIPVTSNPRGVPADLELNVRVDPEFVGVGDFHLRQSSPAVNAGVAKDAPTRDRDGDERVAFPDIGCDETPQLRISVVPDRISEGAPPQVSIVTLERNMVDVSTAVVATLSNSNHAAVEIPSEVTIPALANRVTFYVAPVDDGLIDGPQLADLKATAAGWIDPNPATVQVEDDELLPAFPIGSQTQVNPASPWDDEPARVAMAADGSFVVAYAENSNQGWDIFAQRYNASGVAIGTRITVNTTTSSSQWRPSIAMEPTGNFVVVWRSEQGGTTAIFGQRFNATGQKLGGELQVSTSTGSKDYPEVGMAADGSFMVVWSGTVGSGPFGGIARRFDSNGVALSDEFLISADHRASLLVPQNIAIHRDGKGIVVWQDNFGQTWGQLFGVNGEFVGSAFRLSDSSTVNWESMPNVAINASGEFVATWTSVDGAGTGIFWRRFAADGTPLSEPQRANTYTANDQSLSDVALTDQGGFVITWTSNEQDGASSGVYAQQFLATGFPLGSEFRVATTTAFNQLAPHTAIDSLQNYVISWQGYSPNDSDGVYFQRFRQPAVEFALAVDTSTVRENAGGTAILGTVTRTGVNLKMPLAVQLTAETPETLLLPDQVEIPAGASSVDFSIGVMDDDVHNGTRQIAITASAGGFPMGQTIITVLDAEPPMVSSSPGAASYPINGAPIFVDANAVVEDADSANFGGGTLSVSITANGDDSDRLSILPQSEPPGEIGLQGNAVLFRSVVVGTVSGGSLHSPLVVVLNEFATPEATQAILRRIAFENESCTPNLATRNVQFTVTDGRDGTSNVAAKQISLNGPSLCPVLHISSADLVVLENDGPQVLDDSATISDVDSADFQDGILTVEFEAAPMSGDRLSIHSQGTATGEISFDGAIVWYGSDPIGAYTGGFTTNLPLQVRLNEFATPFAVEALVRNLSFENVSDSPPDTTRTIRIQLTDGDGGVSRAVMKRVRVIPVNDAPSVSGSIDEIRYVENSPMAPILKTIEVVDVDSNDFGNGELRVEVTIGGTRDDHLSILQSAPLSTNDRGDIFNGAVDVGDYTVDDDNRTLTVKFQATATASIVQTVLRNVAYRNSSDDPSAVRTVVFHLSDGDGGEGTVFTKVVTVVPTNDPPTLDIPQNIDIDEDSEVQTLVLQGISPGGDESQPVRVNATSSEPGVIAEVQTEYLDGTSTALLRFTPLPDRSGVSVITVTVEDGGLDRDLTTISDNGHVERVFFVTVKSVNDLPSLDDIETLVIDEDAPEQVIELRGIGAGGGESQPIRVWATSNAPNLVADPTVRYISPNETGELTIKFSENQFGNATITINVEDGGFDNNLATVSDNAKFQRTFDVLVNSVNDPPVLQGQLDDQVAYVNHSVDFAFPSSIVTDADLGDVVTWRAMLTDGEGFPSWLAFDPDQRRFLGTPAQSDIGILAIRIVGFDSGIPVKSASLEFRIDVRPEELLFPWHNSLLDMDVDNDGIIAPIDVLLIINHLNSVGSGTLPGRQQDSPYLDTNSDGFCSPLDALLVINELNGAPEGESPIMSLLTDHIWQTTARRRYLRHGS